MFAIFKKEVWSYFGSWLAWLIIAVFSLISALFLFFFESSYNIFDIGSASLQSYFTLVPWILLFVVPALAMKSIAEEQQSGTLYWLFSQPLKISDIVLGKFFSIWLLGILCLLPSLVYLYTVYVLGVPEGNLDFGATLGSYFGLLCLIGAFSAVGILSSAVAPNQIMAYLAGVSLSFIFYFGIEQLANYKLLGGADFLVQYLGFYHHFMGFSRGIIDSRDVFYFVLFTGICLQLAIVFVKKKK